MTETPPDRPLMIHAFRLASARLISGWTDAVTRRAAWVIVAALLLTVASIWYLATHIAINTDNEDMLSADLPFRQDARALDAAFPQFDSTLLVVIEGATYGIADDAALALGMALKTKTGVIADVYDLEGHPFFRQNGLLYLDEDALIGLSDRLAEAQPFLGALWRDPSLRGLSAMLSKAVDHAAENAGDLPIDLVPVLNDLARVAEAGADGNPVWLDWRALMQGETAGPAYRYILTQPKLDYGSLAPASDAMRVIRAEAERLGLTKENGIRVRLTGSAALEDEELKSVEQGMGLAGIISFVAVLALLFMGLRSTRLVAATLITLIAGLIWTAAFAILAVGTLNLISVAFAVLFIGLSVDFGIHYVLRYREEAGGTADKIGGLVRAAAEVGAPLALTAVAAAIGFFAFLPTDYVGLAELGLIAGTGMFIALIANLTLLPALLAVMPGGVPPIRHKRYGTWTWHLDRPKRVVGMAGLVGVVACTISFGVEFDFDPMNLRDPDTESVSTLLDVMADPRTNPYTITVLADHIGHAYELGRAIRQLPEVKGTRMLLDFIPGKQDDKLFTIGSMALFLGPALTGDPTAPPSATERSTALRTLKQRLETLAAAGEGGLQAAAARLAKALPDITQDVRIDALERAWLRDLPGRLRALKTALEAEAFDQSDLPRSLVEREVSEDGRVRLEVYPSGDMTDRAQLSRFVESVRGLAPRATGAPVIIYEAGNTVVEAFVQAAVIALAVIGILLLVLLGNLRDVMLVFAPLVLAAVLTLSASVIFAVPFNFANVIVLPLLFGLGVAGGIHLVVRARDGEAAVEETSTPRAVLFSALTTIGSFGSIALSSHPGTSSMGVLLTIALALTLVCTLIVLPALMRLLPPKGFKAGER